MPLHRIAFAVLMCACVSGANRATEKLAASVTIYRDTWGVPHIYAKTDAGAVLGLMYAQAEDNFWQLEEDYIRSLGRAAEIYGARSAAGDAILRGFEVNKRAMEQYERADPKLKDLCDAFAAGVNLYLEKHPQVAPRLLTRFEPWFVLVHDHATRSPFALGITAPEFKQAIPEIAELMASADVRLPDEPPLPVAGEEPDEGSNMWAVGPSKSASGHAMLLINPHVGFFGGGQRYEAHLHSNEGLDVSGFAILGTPYIRSGHNGRLGWSHTNNYADTADVYVETFDDPANPLAYLYGKEHRVATEWTDELKVKTDRGIETRTLRFRKTHHGTIFGVRGGHPLAVRVAGIEGGVFEERWAMAKARNLAEFKAALSRVSFTGSNTIYADRGGNIFYLHGNAVPKRLAKLDWEKPVDGSDPETEWQGYHKIEELPQVTNPSSGFVQNCNSTPFLTTAGADNPDSARYPSYMAPEKDTPRAQRSRDILSGTARFTFEDWTRAGLDSRVGQAKTRVPELLDQFARLEAADPARASKVEPLVAEVKSWDQVGAIASVPTTLFVRMLIRSNESTDAKDPYPLVSAIEKVKAGLESDWGTWQVAWGDVNRLQRIHTSGTQEQFNDAKPSVAVPGAPTFTGTIFTFGARPAGGQKRWYGTVGDTYVSMVEFSKRPEARSLLVFGENADPASPHYFDQAKLYSEQHFKPAWFDLRETKAHTERRYHPGGGALNPRNQ